MRSRVLQEKLTRVRISKFYGRSAKDAAEKIDVKGG